MTRHCCLLALLGALSLHGQVVLVSVNQANAVETSIGPGGYNYGAVAAGDSVDVRFHARNLGSGPVTITNLRIVNGTNFTIVNTSSTPYTVPPGGGPGSVMAIFVRFSGAAIASYTATLQVTYTDASSTASVVSAALVANVVPAPIVGVGPPCTGPDANKNVDFGRVVQGSKVTCSWSVQNPNTQALPIALSGAGFTASFGSSTTVGAGLTGTFSLTFTAATASNFAGTLTVGPRTYTLSGAGFSQPLPTPVWTFDNSTFSSGEQHTLSIGFATPSPVTASGFVTMTFSPAAANVTDDVAVEFVATSQRVASFTVNAGDMGLTLAGLHSIIFSTGTTAGKIVFTINPGAYGITGDATTTLSIGSAPIHITAASTTSRANDLDVVITGFDNTYTAGPMSFAFFDRSGNQMGGLVPADFSASFSAYFRGQSGGSAFLMRISFPVTGDASTVGGVEATFNNAAGAARTGRLSFP